MSIEYIVSGGRLVIDKHVYIKEMLSKDGVLRKMVLSNGNDSIEEKPKITKNDLEQTVTINFNGSSTMDIGENYRELFQTLKAKYQDKIKGKIVIRISYFSIIYVTIDLNNHV